MKKFFHIEKRKKNEYKLIYGLLYKQNLNSCMWINMQLCMHNSIIVYGNS